MQPQNSAKEKINLLNKNYWTVFASEAGKEILKDLKRVCFYNISTFISGSSELEIIHREGARTILLYILSRIRKGGKLIKGGE